MPAGVAMICCGILLGGCGERPGERQALLGDRSGSDLEWGEEDRGAQRSAARPAATGRAPSTRWTILLRTFRPEDPHDAPTNFIESCASIEPRLAAAQVLRRGPGRIVVYGSYESADHPHARRDLEWIQSIEFRGGRLLPRALLTRINLRHMRGEYLPNELHSVRLTYPTQHPLYTLQVEAWGDFGSGTMTLEQVQMRAEERVRELRRQGYQAYFHHDDDQKLSSISIGVFDAGAWDAQSGILIDLRLEKLMKEFPVHLLNGEPVEQLIDPRNPRRGGVPQRPTLVEVPRW